jgi:gliding motility-associated-like protein
MFDSDNLLSTCSGIDATHQIAIYETTNVIEVYIDHKTACPAPGFFTTQWNDGLAIEGIQDASQTVAYTVPGRNNTVWNASNDAWRFTPNGPSIVTINWYKGATQIASGASVQVCPGSNTTYTAEATYTPCAGGTPVVVTDNVNVTLAGALQAAIDSSHNISCFGLNNGSAYAHATTSNAGLAYGWSNGSHNLSISNLSAGIYVFTASDNSGCIRSDTVVITQPTQLTVSVPNVTQTNCAGTGTGTLVASCNGGNYPYGYVWNSAPVQNDSLLDNVTAGNYTVTVIDVSGCTASASGTLTINAGGNTVTLNNPVITNVKCFGGNTGQIIASATGGSGIFNYSWNNGETGNTDTALVASNYAVTVNDGAGCTASATYNVTQPTAVLINAPAIQNIGCGGVAAGSITANASGGTPAYNYNWTQQSNSQSYSGQAIANLPADNYSLTVTDANNCSVTATYQITAVTPLVFTQASTNVSCFGGSNGTATITVFTGTPPYQYNWNGAGNSANAVISTLIAGTATVTVSDANCSATASFVIAQPTQLVITQTGGNVVSCAGGNNGTVTVVATGGTPDYLTGYTYAWSNLQIGTTATGLSAGAITVVVTDSSLCTASATYNITQPTALSLTLTPTDATCYQGANGSVVASSTGGTPPYNYLWNNLQTTATASALLAGTYNCTVTDANGCSATSANVVNEPADMQISISTTAVKCIGDKNGTISVSATGGTPPYNFSATQDFSNFVFATNGVIIGLAVGDYTVVIADNNGCTHTRPAHVNDAIPDDFNTSTDSTSCYGPDYNDGAAHIVATSVVNTPYQFGIDGGPMQVTGDFYNLSAGAHTINAINANGCPNTIPILILEPNPIIVDVVPDTVVLPLGESQQVLVNYLNATNPMYNWTASEGLSCIDCPNPVVSAYKTTDYAITVSMINGTSTCYGTATLHVDVLPHKPVFIPNTFSPNGDGNNDLFQVYGEDIKSVGLKIFNRWGELIYETTNMLTGWDGTYKGQLQQPQVYTYIAEIIFLDDTKQTRKGSMTILR